MEPLRFWRANFGSIFLCRVAFNAEKLLVIRRWTVDTSSSGSCYHGQRHRTGKILMCDDSCMLISVASFLSPRHPRHKHLPIFLCRCSHPWTSGKKVGVFLRSCVWRCPVVGFPKSYVFPHGSRGRKVLTSRPVFLSSGRGYRQAKSLFWGLCCKSVSCVDDPVHLPCHSHCRFATRDAHGVPFYKKHHAHALLKAERARLLHRSAHKLARGRTGSLGATPASMPSSTPSLSSRPSILSSSPATTASLSLLSPSPAAPAAADSPDDANGIAPDHCSPTPYMLYPKPTPIPAPTLDWRGSDLGCGSGGGRAVSQAWWRRPNVFGLQQRARLPHRGEATEDFTEDVDTDVSA